MELIVVQTATYNYLFPIICAAGILGNLMILLTVLLGNLKDSPYIYLSTLAIADLIALINIAGISAVRCVGCYRSPEVEYIGKVYEIYAYLPLSNIAAVLVSLTTLLMTLERFVYVRYPLASLNICTRKKAKKVVCGLVMISIVLNLPRFFLYDVKMFSNVTMFDDTTKVPSFLKLDCEPCGVTRGLTDGPLYCNISLPVGYFTGEADERGNNKTYESSDIHLLTYPEDKCKLDFNKILNEDRHPALRMMLVTEQNSVFRYDSYVGQLQNGSGPTDNFTHELFDDIYSDSLNDTTQDYDDDGGYFTINGTMLTPSQRIVYNLTDNGAINRLLTNFPCARKTRFWGVNFAVGRPNRYINKTETEFSQLIATKYFLFLSILYTTPFIVVGFLNCYIIYIVRKSATSRRRVLMERTKLDLGLTRQKEQDHLTITLLCLTGIQVLTNTIYVFSITPVAQRIYDGELDNNDNYKIHIMICNLFLLVQYSSNFLFFAFLNGRFQKEFKRVLISRVSRRVLLRRKVIVDRRTRTVSHIEEPERKSPVTPRLSTSTVESLCFDD